jgi:hypothetical protein
MSVTAFVNATAATDANALVSDAVSGRRAQVELSGSTMGPLMSLRQIQFGKSNVERANQGRASQSRQSVPIEATRAECVETPLFFIATSQAATGSGKSISLPAESAPKDVTFAPERRDICP